MATLGRQLQHHGFEPHCLDGECLDWLLLYRNERLMEFARMCYENGLTTVAALVRACREGSLPVGLRVSDAVELERIAKMLGKHFLWQSDTFIRADFEDVLSRLLLRANWTRMSLEMLQERVEAEVGCCTDGDLALCRVALGGALLRRLRDMDKPEAHKFMFSCNTEGQGCRATLETSSLDSPVLAQCLEPCDGCLVVRLYVKVGVDTRIDRIDRIGIVSTVASFRIERKAY